MFRKLLVPMALVLLVFVMGTARGDEAATLKSLLVQADIKFLTKLWKKLSKKADKTRAPGLIYKDMEIITRLVRDIFTEDVTSVVIDSKREYRQIISYLRSFAPDLRSRVHLYKEDTPIFDAYEIEKETEKILSELGKESGPEDGDSGK